jgi:hypothetical protein
VELSTAGSIQLLERGAFSACKQSKMCWLEPDSLARSKFGLMRAKPNNGHSEIGRMHTNCLPAARCIRATLFEKIDDRQFPSLRVHVLTRRISAVACLVCSMAQAEPLEATGS